LGYSSRSEQRRRRTVFPTIKAHFWFKCFGTVGFTLTFFSAYIYLLKNPGVHVTTMPITAVDSFVVFEPLALPIYLSLWIYLSLPPTLMQTRREIIEYGGRIGGLCLVGLGIFYFWPTAVPPANIDWAKYPGMAFLKGVDAAGNACPSLHVATAVFSAIWLHRQLGNMGGGLRIRFGNGIWCVAIIYSALATKQHVSLDVLAGLVLGIAYAYLSLFIYPDRAQPRIVTTERQ
jgi:membrane-associated phospholipid phosphatase